MQPHYLSVAVVALLLTVGWNQSMAAEKAPRGDRQGDPLPVGALARLGTVRLHHPGQVSVLVYSPDGKWLASAGDDSVVRVWDAEDGKEVHSFAGHQGKIHGLAFIPPGKVKQAKTLMSAGQDGTIRFWDMTTGKMLPQSLKHPGAARALAVSPDGKHVASAASAEPYIYLWQVADGKLVRRWKAHLGGTFSLAFAPDGKALASGGSARSEPTPADKREPADNCTLALWDVSTGEQQHDFGGHPNHVRAVAFSADGKVLASSGRGHEGLGRSVLLWDRTTGRRLRAFHEKGILLDQRDPPHLALSPDGKALVTADNYSILVWDIASSAPPRPLASPHTCGADALAFSPDGHSLASAGGPWLASAWHEGRIVLWDVARRIPKLSFEAHAQSVHCVAVSGDGKLIATGSFDGTARLWDRGTGKPLKQLQRDVGPRGGLSAVFCMAFSPDGHKLALGQCHAITLWDVPTRKFERQIRQDFASTMSLAFSPDSKLLASETVDLKSVSLWDLKTGQAIRTFERTENRGTSVAISPDGRFLASTANKALFLWELGTGKLVYQQKSEGWSMTFSPGGLLLVTAGSRVAVRETATGKELAHLGSRAQAQGWKSAAFSPDGRFLAVVDTERVRLWDVCAQREVRSLRGHRAPITSVAFTPDGKALVSGSMDCTALIWDLTEVLPRQKPAQGQTLWDELKNPNRLRAYAAFCGMRAAPEKALSVLKQELRPVLPIPANRLGQLIKDLDSSKFQARERATQELLRLGMAAEPALRLARKGELPLEMARRIDILLVRIDAALDWQRELWALRFLEDLNNASARALLPSLTKGDANVRLTREAEAALERMHRLTKSRQR